MFVSPSGLKRSDVSIKKNREKVIETLERLDGFEGIVEERRNGHGPTIRFRMCGQEWDYGYDTSPKAEYGAEKTRKAIRHSMLAKASKRNLTNQAIYKGTEWQSQSSNQEVQEQERPRLTESKPRKNYLLH